MRKDNDYNLSPLDCYYYVELLKDFFFYFYIISEVLELADSVFINVIFFCQKHDKSSSIVLKVIGDVLTD